MMSPLNQPDLDASARRKTWRIAAVAGALAMMIGFAAAHTTSAQADSKGISGTQTISSLVFWNTVRYNTHANNAMTMRITSYSNSAMQAFSIGARSGKPKTSIQFARTEVKLDGKAYTFEKPNGSYRLPKGAFYLTTKSIHYTCGAPCASNIVSWSGTLTWNVDLDTAS